MSARHFYPLQSLTTEMIIVHSAKNAVELWIEPRRRYIFVKEMAEQYVKNGPRVFPQQP